MPERTQLHLTVPDVATLLRVLRKLGRYYAWTPLTAAHSQGTFRVGVRGGFEGTWSVQQLRRKRK